MHYITAVQHSSGFKLHLRFEEGEWRSVNLEPHLDGEIFEPLRDASRFSTAHLNKEIDTVAWDNGADMSPDFLYEISVPLSHDQIRRVAEEEGSYEVE
jgi:hypothetical protein